MKYTRVNERILFGAYEQISNHIPHFALCILQTIYDAIMANTSL